MGTRSRADIRRSIHGRIRKKIKGTSDRPRLTVYRSTNHIYAQVVDDVSGKTLVSASTVEKDFRSTPGGNVKAAELIGKAIAERAIGAGISNVVYDRGGFIYHGRVKALLDATRAAGLNQDGSSVKGSGATTGKATDKKASAKETAKKPSAKETAKKPSAKETAKKPKTAKTEKKPAEPKAKKSAAKDTDGDAKPKKKSPAKKKASDAKETKPKKEKPAKVVKAAETDSAKDSNE